MSDVAQQNSDLVPKIIWGALTFSLVVHLGLALFIADPTPEQVALMEKDSTAMIYFGIGLMNMGLAIFVLPNVMKPKDPKNSSELLTPRIIQWAVIESGMILGLLSSFSGGPDVVAIGLFVVAVLAMLKTFPNDLQIASDPE